MNAPLYLIKMHVPRSHSRAKEAQVQVDKAAEQWKHRQSYARPENILDSFSIGAVFLLPTFSWVLAPSCLESFCSWWRGIDPAKKGFGHELN